MSGAAVLPGEQVQMLGHHDVVPACLETCSIMQAKPVSDCALPAGPLALTGCQSAAHLTHELLAGGKHDGQDAASQHSAVPGLLSVPPCRGHRVLLTRVPAGVPTPGARVCCPTEHYAKHCCMGGGR